MDPNLSVGNCTSNEGAAPAPPSAVMQALQSFQAAADASSTLYRNSSSPHPQMHNQQAQRSGSSSTTPFSQSQVTMPTCAPTFNTQQRQAQAFPNVAQRLPQLQQQQALQEGLQGLSFLMPSGSNDPQQLWLQQALQTLATVQQLQSQQPQTQGTTSIASAPSTTSSAPNALATTSLLPILPAPSHVDNAAAAAAAQQHLFQLHNLLSFPLQLQVPVPAPSPSGVVPQQQQQAVVVPPPLMLQPPAAMAAPTAAARRPSAPAPVGRNNKRRREIFPKGTNTCPSIISVSNSSSNGGRGAQVNNSDKGYDDDDKPPQEKSPEELEKMTPNERRRYERNLREQQRSYKISQQIKELRDVLQESNIPFRPNKYSILVSVADYVKQLQGRAIMLDSEHQRLIDTIRQTNDRGTSVASNGGNSVSALSDGQEDVQSSMDGCSTSDGLTPHSHLLFVQGIDYMAVFKHCPYPIGVATLDGRMLDCNQAFEDLLEVEAGSLKDQSFFACIRNHQEIFHAMAALLKQSSMESETGLEPKPGQEQLFWNGEMVSQHNARFPFTITLTSGADENPLFFSLSAAVSLVK